MMFIGPFLAPGATGTTDPRGLSRFRNASVVATALAVKATAGNVYRIHARNAGTAPAYLLVYDVVAASVTVGTTPVLEKFTIPGEGALFLDGGTIPVTTHATAIAIAAVTGFADSSTTAPSTNTIAVTAYYL